MVVGAVMSTLASWKDSGKSNGIPALDLGALRPRTVTPRSTRVGGVLTTAQRLHT